MSRNKSGAKGTKAAGAVARYLTTHGWPSAERRSLKGGKDEGDITGTPGLCWEVKIRARPVYDKQVADWLIETENERRHARADFGILVVHRPGVGMPRAGEWWAIVPLGVLAALLALGEAGVPIAPGLPYDTSAPVRMLLDDLVPVLHRAGYGDALSQAVAS